MSKLELFKNENFGEVRTVIENEQVLFCAKDVAGALGYKNTQKAVIDHCKRGGSHFVTHPQNPDKTIEMVFIPESDVYRLIVKSKLPQAEEFEKWLFEEVLPSIRKHGGYITNQENLTQEEILAKALIVAQNVINEKDKLNKQLQVQNSQLAVDNQIMKPKADYFDELVDRNLLTNFRETAKQLGIKEKEFIKFLLDKKYLYRDKRGKLMAYADKNNGLFAIKESVNEKTKWTGTQTLITPKGRETFRLLFI